MDDKKNQILKFFGAFFILSGAVPLVLGTLADTLTFEHILFRLALCAIGFAIVRYSERDRNKAV